jgi:hypothetical protein
VNATGLLFDVEDAVLTRPGRSVPTAMVSRSEPELTPVAGVALWGPLLDRLNLVAEADRRGLRPIGPGGHTGGACYRALVEISLAGGDFLSDRALLADPATATLRGTNALPSVSTSWRFLAGADLGRVAKAGAVNRVLLRRAWAAGAAPEGDRLTIDPDATRVAVYGPGKEGSAFSRTGQTALSPLVGVCGERRGRAGPAGPRRRGQRRPGDGPLHRRVRGRLTGAPRRVLLSPVCSPARTGDGGVMRALQRATATGRHPTLAESQQRALAKVRATRRVDQ